ncbi:MAG: CehA/McbA family metallohydrolase [Kiritimatiellae bacterium]|nr:CehA/McbA family metallohydrolase [Kiritimatiellia bacterium]
MSTPDVVRRRFRYNTSGKWYKGNTHIHTTASDGGMNIEQIERLYSQAGYDFLFATDHGIPSSFDTGRQENGLIWLNGVELDGRDERNSFFHVVCLGEVRPPENKADLTTVMQAARQQGALLILAHPHWTGNTLEDAIRWEFDGVEIYNHVCHWLNGKSDGLVYWNAMLRQRPGTLAFAVDDAHLRPEHPGWDGGWVMVNAREKTALAIREAIRSGNFYSSCGPEIRSLRINDGQLVIETSPVKFVRLVGPAWNGRRQGSFEDKRLTSVTFELPPDWDYMYVEVEDEAGRRAWTNTLFVE